MAGPGDLHQTQVRPAFLRQADCSVWELGDLDAPEQSAIDQLPFQPPDSVGTRAQDLAQLLDAQEWMSADQVQQLLVAARRTSR
jgi:hypothetical protein